jgi:plasmid stabilization system protein ParE
MTRYAFHPEAEADIGQIWAYIAAANPDAADRLVADFQEALELAADFPQRGHRRRDLTQRQLRS